MQEKTPAEFICRLFLNCEAGLHTLLNPHPSNFA